jgi:hypothetical protein
MKTPMNKAASPLRRQAADVLLRARKLPPGPDRNDLRQLGARLPTALQAWAAAKPKRRGG